MQFTKMATWLLADDPTAAANFYAEHFGFTVAADIGWYVSLTHPSGSTIDFVQRDHESVQTRFRRPTGGVGLAFLVEDAAAEEERLRAAGVPIALPLVDEPWGQRRFQVEAPAGEMVEVLQVVAPDPEWMAANGF
ncbi:VOC family protein [Umezawaea beigongshangensis]|uniref:VOC family protein n=1 Tax=Umezawaea beigongshangensis TaxID=2780383 RepID=UPI0018F240DB|nr:VOC family protein [Umezawaea beigongshangensis]